MASAKQEELNRVAESVGIKNPKAYFFRNDPPAYWVIDGDNIDTVDLGMNFEQALSALKRSEWMHGGKIEIH